MQLVTKVSIDKNKFSCVNQVFLNVLKEKKITKILRNFAQKTFCDFGPAQNRNCCTSNGRFLKPAGLSMKLQTSDPLIYNWRQEIFTQVRIITFVVILVSCFCFCFVAVVVVVVVVDGIAAVVVVDDIVAVVTVVAAVIIIIVVTI